jgi:mannose-6-phosphate isomerase-like protein (cupin superfamily)
VRKLRTTDLAADGADSVLASAVPGHRVGTGGVALLTPGERSYPGERHVHDFPEAFVILAGRGEIEIAGTATGIAAGDVLVVAPGEDHHLVSSVEHPLVTVWLHLEPPAAGGPA